MNIGEIFASLKIKADEWNKGIQGARNGLSSFQQFSVNAFNTVAKYAAIGAAAAGAAFAAFSIKAINAASDAQEIQNKFSVVFEAVSGKAESMASSLAKNYGLSQTAAKDLLSSTGDLLTGFGFTDEKALELSNSVQELSVDLASFQNLQGGAAQASEILTKAMLGERDALIALGVKISEADVEARLLAEGKQNLTGNALLAAKAEATYALVLEQTGKAQGDFARSSDSLANQKRILQARIENISASIGKRFIPFATAAVKTVSDWLPKIESGIDLLFKFGSGLAFAVREGDVANDMLFEVAQKLGISREAFNNVAKKAEEFRTTLINLGKDVQKKVQPLIEKFGEFLGKKWRPLIAGALTILITMFGAWAVSAAAAAASTIAAAAPVIAIFAAIGAAGYLMYEIINGNLFGIRDAFMNFINSEPVQAFITIVRDTLVSIFNNLRAAFMEAWTMIQAQLIPALLNLWNSLQPVLKVIMTIAGFIVGVLIVALLKWWEFLSSLLMPALKILITIITAVINIIAGLIDFIVKLVGWIISFVNTALSWWNKFKDGVSYVWNVIKGVIEGVFNGIKNFISDRIEDIKNIIKGLIDSVRTTFNKVKEVAQGIFDGVVGTVKGAINGLIDMINGAIDGINGMISTANEVPGVNIGKIGKLPRLAIGTENFGGGLAVVGEQGRELVNMPSGSSVSKTNRTESLFSLFGEIAGSLMRFMNIAPDLMLNGLSAAGAQNIHVHVDLSNAYIMDEDFAEEIGEDVGDAIVDKLSRTRRTDGN